MMVRCQTHSNSKVFAVPFRVLSITAFCDAFLSVSAGARLATKSSAGHLRGRWAALCLMIFCCGWLPPITATAEDTWLQFRGAGGRSASTGKTPLTFGGDANQNIAWNFPTAGRGVGGPLVVGGLVITTSSSGEDERDLYVEAVDRESGQLAWRRTAHALGRPFAHPTSANAAPTPASDGQRVFAFYSSCDLLCYSTEGRLLWYRALAVDHPKAGNDVGMASSPAVIDGVVTVQVENQGDSFAIGLDAETGKTLWQLERPRRANWSSPLAIRLNDGRPAFVLQSTKSTQVVGHRSGEILLEFGLEGSSISSPVVTAGSQLLIPANGLTVIDLAISTPDILYENSRLRTRNSSHVVFKDRVYCCSGSVLVAADLNDGEVLWQQRLPGIRSVWATPVVSESGIYVFDQDGAVAILRDDYESDDPECEVLEGMNIPGPVLGSPAVVDGAIYVRSELALLKIAAPN